ncbi:MAG: N utilization substance protein A [bacterium]|nr:MAG: N utilization substance protein A [bacterium]
MKREVAIQIEALMSSATVPLNAIEGIDPVHSAKLKEAGIETLEQLANCSSDDIATTLDVSLDDANSLLDFAHQIIKAKSEKNIDNVSQSLASNLANSATE